MGVAMPSKNEAKKFYDKVIAGDTPAPEDVDNVFDVMDMLMKEVESAHTFLEELEDAACAYNGQAEDLPDLTNFRRQPEKASQVF